MKFKLKDPGSAITHGIALLLAAVGAVPLIIKAARSYDVLHIVALSIFYTYHGSALCSQYYLPFCRFYREGQSTAAKNGSHDDFCDDRRKLYSCMPDRSS